ncbi:hypothetical protein ScPMuIL_002397 [Solemya velum]
MSKRLDAESGVVHRVQSSCARVERPLTHRLDFNNARDDVKDRVSGLGGPVSTHTQERSDADGLSTNMMEYNACHGQMPFQMFVVRPAYIGVILSPEQCSKAFQVGIMPGFRMKGIIPAVFTPFTADRELNLDAIPGYADFLKENAIECVYVNGSTGEGSSMSIQERKTMMEKWIGECHKRSITVIAQVGGLNLKDSCELAAHAQAVGADAISSLPPLFFKPSTLELLIDYCCEVAQAAPNLPFYYYHIPVRTGVSFNMEDFLALASPRIPTLTGIKFSFSDQADLLGCTQFEGCKMNILFGSDQVSNILFGSDQVSNILFGSDQVSNILFGSDQVSNILFGSDQQLLSALAMGADGAVGTTYNFLPQIFHRLLKAFNDGDVVTARKEQYRASTFIKIILRYGDHFGGPLAAFKSIMTLIGQDQGPPRQPFKQASEPVLQKMKEELEKVDFFNSIK